MKAEIECENGIVSVIGNEALVEIRINEFTIKLTKVEAEQLGKILKIMK